MILHLRYKVGVRINVPGRYCMHDIRQQMRFCPNQLPIATCQHRQQWASLLGSHQTVSSIRRDVRAVTFALTIPPINYPNHSTDGLTLEVFRELKQIQYNTSELPYRSQSNSGLVLQFVSGANTFQGYCAQSSNSAVSQNESVFGKTCSPTAKPQL